MVSAQLVLGIHLDKKRKAAAMGTAAMSFVLDREAHLGNSQVGDEPRARTCGTRNLHNNWKPRKRIANSGSPKPTAMSEQKEFAAHSSRKPNATHAGREATRPFGRTLTTWLTKN